MPETVSFIHAADLHLDSPFLGLATSPKQVYQAVEESTFYALERLVDLALEKRVDFILLVGDIFDRANQSLKAKLRLKNAFDRLNQADIMVYMSYGNHDYSYYSETDSFYPSNVLIFPPHKVTSFNYPPTGEPRATIYGFSYETQHIKEGRIGAYKRVNSGADFHIASLHGSLSGLGGHEDYAPFRIKDIENKGFDYWALGHIHQRQIIREDPPVVYPGNIQGRHALEGGAKGCYYVQLSKHHCDLSFESLESIRFASLEIEVSRQDSIYDLEAKLQKEIGSMKKEGVPYLIRLHLLGDPILLTWKGSHHLEDMIEVMNELLLRESPWIYIYEMVTSVDEPSSPKIEDGHFIHTLYEEFSKGEVAPLLTDLYEHAQARKFLQPLSDGEKNEIKTEAKRLIIEALLPRKR